MTNVIIWAETTYKTRHCRNCGHILREEGPDGMPTKAVTEKKVNGVTYLFCRHCGLACGKKIKSDKSRDELVKDRDKNGARWGADE